MDLVSLAGELGAARLALLDVLTKAPEEAWAPQKWGLREVLAHIAARDEATAASIRAAIEMVDPLPAITDINQFNQAAAAEFARLPAVQVMVRLHAARARLVALLSRAEGIEEFRYPFGERGLLEPLIVELVAHERRHTKALAETLGPAAVAGNDGADDLDDLDEDV